MNLGIHTYKVHEEHRIMEKLKDFSSLVKMRLSLLVVFSSLMGYLYASSANINVLTLMALLIGGFLITGASNAFNQVYEMDIDAQMIRTKERPIPAGRMTAIEGLYIGVLMSALGFYVLLKYVNPACAIMSALSLLSYVFAYTPLKRVSHIATFVGAIPGAMPFAIGWFAFGGQFHVEVLILFFIQFIWQFPHTWAIAWLQKTDYQKVNIKLNPFGVNDDKRNAYYILLYTIVLIPASLMPMLYGYTNVYSAIVLLVLGIYFVKKAVDLYNEQTEIKARGVLMGSIIYLPLVQIALVLDKIFI